MEISIDYHFYTIKVDSIADLTYLLRERAAVFFRHPFLHGFFYRLHLFAQRYTGGRGGFDHIFINKVSFFALQNTTGFKPIK